MAPCVTGLCTKRREDVIETDDIVKVPRVGFEITYLSYFSIFSTSSPGKSMPS